MNIKAVLIAIIFLAVEVNCHAARLKVHPDEQAAMDALLNRLNIDEKDIIVGKNELQTNYYSDYFDAGVRYFYESDNNFELSVITNKFEHVSRLRISKTNLNDLREVEKFTETVILEITSNDLTNLNGLNKLKKIKNLKILGNKKLIDIGGINNLPNLVEIDAVTLKNISIKGMKNLPKLERFLCDSCLIDDIAPLSHFISLKTLKLGVKQKNINHLRKLSNLETIEVKGSNLVDVTAIENMENLKYLEIEYANIDRLPLSKLNIDLEFIRLGDVPIKTLPNFKGFNKLKSLTITGTEVYEVNTIRNLPNLEVLRFARNNKLTRVSDLNNLPSLKELKIYKGPLEVFITSNLPSLEELYLSETNIARLEGFENYPSLRRLIINDTKITSLKGIERAPMLYSVQADYDVKNDPDNEKILRSLRKNLFKRKSQ